MLPMWDLVRLGHRRIELLGRIASGERHIGNRLAEKPAQWFPALAEIVCKQAIPGESRLNVGDVFLIIGDGMGTIVDATAEHAIGNQFQAD